jgi:hypothetical protein
VKRVVLHPSGFADWFVDGGIALRGEFEAGQLEVMVPNSFVVDARPSGASYAALASWLDVAIAVADEDLRRALKALPQAI